MTYLDCGCCINDDGTRTWCPTCLNGPISTQNHTADCLMWRTAKPAIRGVYKWRQNDTAEPLWLYVSTEMGKCITFGSESAFDIPAAGEWKGPIQ